MQIIESGKAAVPECAFLFTVKDKLISNGAVKERLNVLNPLECVFSLKSEGQSIEYRETAGPFGGIDDSEINYQKDLEYIGNPLKIIQTFGIRAGSGNIRNMGSIYSRNTIVGNTICSDGRKLYFKVGTRLDTEIETLPWTMECFILGNNMKPTWGSGEIISDVSQRESKYGVSATMEKGILYVNIPTNYGFSTMNLMLARTPDIESLDSRTNCLIENFGENTTNSLVPYSVGLSMSF